MSLSSDHAQQQAGVVALQAIPLLGQRGFHRGGMARARKEHRMSEQKDEKKDDHVHFQSAWTGNVIMIAAIVAIIVAALVYKEYFA